MRLSSVTTTVQVQAAGMSSLRFWLGDCPSITYYTSVYILIVQCSRYIIKNALVLGYCSVAQRKTFMLLPFPLRHGHHLKLRPLPMAVPVVMTMQQTIGPSWSILHILYCTPANARNIERSTVSPTVLHHYYYVRIEYVRTRTATHIKCISIAQLLFSFCCPICCHHCTLLQLQRKTL